jgi:carboxymethylenebutenolidase
MTPFLKSSTLWASCGLALVFTSFSAASHAQDWAKARLEQSPRHREYVSIKHDGRTINTYVVYPEVKGKAPVVVLIHEIFGLSDWMKLEADEVAAKGYIVVAPDLLSGSGPNGGGSDALYASPGGQDAVIKGVMGLDATQVNLDLDAVADYGKKLSAASGKVMVGGFCWGGGKSFEFATHRSDLSAALVFYGTPPTSAQVTKIHAPVYGFYAENDARVSSTIPAATEEMKAAGKTYEPVTYAGAGHGFMRSGQAPDASEANRKAFDEGSARMFEILAKAK